MYEQEKKRVHFFGRKQTTIYAIHEIKFGSKWRKKMNVIRAERGY